MLPVHDPNYIAALASGRYWPRGTGTLVLTYDFWEPGDTPFRVEGSDFSSPRAFDAAERAAFERALERISAVADIRFVHVDYVDSASADLRAVFGDFYDDDVAASAYYPPIGELQFNDQSYFDDLDDGSTGFEIILHELGHALGLKHPFEDFPRLGAGYDHTGYTVMSYTDHPGTGYDSDHGWYPVSARTMMLYDIAALQSIYGANRNHRTGDDVYRYPDGVARLETIWDAGGTDTIDASGQVLGAEIDLREGAFSSIGRYGSGWDHNRPAEHNVAIAFGVTIENAIGGAGDDTLIGNDVANRLDGRGGNDVVSGGAGDDVLAGGTGADRLTGGAGADLFLDSWRQIDGDVILDFGGDDRLGVEGAGLALGWSVARTGSDTRLALDGDGNGSVDATVTFSGLVSAAFEAVHSLGTWFFSLGGNTPPDARDDTAATTAGAAVVVDVLANDTDADGTLVPGSVTVTDAPDHGTAAVDAATGRITYTPAAGFTGTDSFVYRVADDDGATDTATVRVTVEAAGSDDESVPPVIRGDGLVWNGTVRNDSKSGTNASDILFGDAGNDVLRGRGDNDHLRGGYGNDRLFGDAGDDWLQGSFGNDRLQGGPGNDLLGGGENNDTLYGQGGSDSFVFREGHGRDTIADAENGEKLFFPGLTLDDLSFSRSGNDLVIRHHGSDSVRVKNFYSRGLSLSINGEVWDGGGGGGGLDWTGTAGADRKNGTDAADRLDGQGGNDVLRGRGGDDVLTGGPGNDRLFGDAGTDTVVFSGDYGDFRVQNKGTSWLVTDLDPSDGDEGTDRIYTSEILQFDDMRLDITGSSPTVLGPASSATALDQLLTPADPAV